MYVHVEHCKEGIRVTFLAIGLYGRSNKRLRKNEFRKFMRFQKIRVCLKELDNKSFERNKVHLRVWVEKVKVDLNSAQLNKFQRSIWKNKKQKQDNNRLFSAVPFVLFFVFLFSFWH